MQPLPVTLVMAIRISEETQTYVESCYGYASTDVAADQPRGERRRGVFSTCGTRPDPESAILLE